MDRPFNGQEKKVSVRKLLSVQPAREGSGVPYLVAFASLPLAVGQEAGEERQVDAVVQRQQEVVGQLEAGGELVEQLPHAVQEEQEDGRLRGWGRLGWGWVQKMEFVSNDDGRGGNEARRRPVSPSLTSSLSLSRWWLTRL